MKVLHIEDYDEEKGVDFAKELNDFLLQKNIQHKNVEFFSELIRQNPSNYDIIILDGQFPEEKNKKPDVSSFQKALRFLEEKKFDKTKIIVWSNSTRVHSICFDSGIVYFSKKDMEIDDYINKQINPKVIAEKAGADKIAQIILSYINFSSQLS